MKRHFFIDVEAYGPPGTGDIFALGIVEFSDTHPGVVIQARQFNISRDTIAAHGLTMDWLMSQDAIVRAQTRGGRPFPAVWQEVQAWLGKELVCFWADDWSDFAWLDIECRRSYLPPPRNLGIAMDSTAVDALAGRPRPDLPPQRLMKHIAMDDATFGAHQLVASLRVLGKGLPT